MAALEAREHSIDEIMAWKDPDWIIDGLIEEQSCVFISAQPTVGKSFFALRLAASVSSGEPLFGHDTNQGNVLFLAAERAKLMKRRVRALQVRGVPIDPDHFKLWPSPVIFSKHDEVREFVRSLKHIPSLLIVDTLRRCNDGDESDNPHMTRWCEGVELFRDLTGSSVLVIHHDHRQSYTKHGTALESSFSGAGAILGSFDGYFTVKPQTNGTILIKSAGANEAQGFRARTCIENVELGNGNRTGIMVEADGGFTIGEAPNLWALAVNVLGDDEITLKQWYERCVQDDEITRHWPNLDESTISKMMKEHGADLEIRKNPDDGRSKLVRLSQK